MYNYSQVGGGYAGHDPYLTVLSPANLQSASSYQNDQVAESTRGIFSNLNTFYTALQTSASLLGAGLGWAGDGASVGLNYLSSSDFNGFLRSVAADFAGGATAVAAAAATLAATENPILAQRVGYFSFYAGQSAGESLYDGTANATWQFFHAPRFEGSGDFDLVSAGPPLVLDLNGDGVSLISLDQSNVFIDIDNDGFKENTGWVKPDDGILVIDLGMDGKVASADEFVLTNWAPGSTSDLEAARIAFDTNHDGKLDASDARWSEFKVWQDLNQDGVSNPGEMKTLAELGITSINLTGIPVMADAGTTRPYDNIAQITRADGSMNVRRSRPVFPRGLLSEGGRYAA